MAENLNYLTSSGSWCYDNNSSNCAKYGRLYNWETARKVCPDGWHLPDDAEWKELEMYLGMRQAEADIIYGRGTDEGGKLKEKGTTHWESPNTGATNESGFSALPSGYCLRDGAFGSMGDYGFWWSSTEYSTAYYAWGRNLYYDTEIIIREYYPKKFGISVRCLRNY